VCFRGYTSPARLTPKRPKPPETPRYLCRDVRRLLRCCNNKVSRHQRSIENMLMVACVGFVRFAAVLRMLDTMGRIHDTGHSVNAALSRLQL
jgi:hypothetical protein